MRGQFFREFRGQWLQMSTCAPNCIDTGRLELLQNFLFHSERKTDEKVRSVQKDNGEE